MVVRAEKFLNRDRGLASEAWDVHNKMDGWMDLVKVAGSHTCFTAYMKMMVIINFTTEINLIMKLFY